MEYKVAMYTMPAGNCPVREYLDALEHSNKQFYAIIMAKLKRLKLPQCHKYPLVKKVGGHGYFEVRAGGRDTARIFYTLHEGVVLLFHAYTKKDMKLKTTELNRADGIYKDIIQGKGSYEEYGF